MNNNEEYTDNNDNTINKRNLYDIIEPKIYTPNYK